MLAYVLYSAKEKKRSFFLRELASHNWNNFRNLINKLESLYKCVRMQAYARARVYMCVMCVCLRICIHTYM